MEQVTVRVVSPEQCVRRWRGVPKSAALWLFWMLFLCFAPASYSDSVNDPSAAAVRKYMTDMDSRGNEHRPGNNEYSRTRVTEFERGLEREVQHLENPSPPESQAPPSVVSDGVVVLGATALSSAFLLLVVLAPKFAPYLNKRFGDLLPGKAAESLSEATLVQEQQFSEFVRRFRHGPKLPTPQPPASQPGFDINRPRVFLTPATVPENWPNSPGPEP